MTNGLSGEGPLRLDEFLPYRLSALAESLSRALARQYAQQFGITMPEWRVIAVLGESAPQMTKDVIARTRMDRVNVSRAAIRLETKGLIVRDPVSADQRAHQLRLSRRGMALYRQIVPIASKLQKELILSLKEDQLHVLEAAIEILLEQADRLARESIPPSTTP